jgi:hypothetical protein
MAGAGALGVEVVHRVEQAVSDAVTSAVFGRSPLLARAVVNTVSGDVPGIIGPGGEPSAWVVETVRRRQAPTVAFLDAIATATLDRGSTPWVPTLGPPVPAGGQQGGEKTAVDSETLTVPGSDVEPSVVAFAVDVPATLTGRPLEAIQALVGERVVVGLAAAVVAALAAAGTAATDLTAAAEALEDAGWVPGLIVASVSAWAKVATDPNGEPRWSGVPVVFGPTGGDVLMLGAGGWWVAVDPTPEFLTSYEPGIGGREVGAIAGYVAVPGPDAVVVVTPA